MLDRVKESKIDFNKYLPKYKYIFKSKKSGIDYWNKIFNVD